MPLPCSFDNRLDVHVLWLPIERLLRQRRIGNQFRRITGATLTGYFRNLMTSDFSASINQLPNTRARTGAEIQFETFSGLQKLKRLQVRRGKIVNMDIVANARAIWRWIVVAEHGDVLALSQCNLQDKRNKMRFWIMIFANVAIGRCTRRIEVSQRGVSQSVGVGVISESSFDD